MLQWLIGTSFVDQFKFKSHILLGSNLHVCFKMENKIGLSILLVIARAEHVKEDISPTGPFRIMPETV